MVYFVEQKFESPIIEAANDFEKEFEETVTCGWGFDFFPDVEQATDDNVPLLATVGIYLEIPGPAEDTVISGSIFVPPQIEAEQIHKAVFDSLVALRQQRSTAPRSDN